MTREELRPWQELQAGTYMAHIGPLLRDKREGHTAFGLQTGEAHANLLGIVHGGVLGSLLDQAIAVTAWTAAGRLPTVTVQMDIRYLGAVRPGQFLEALATVRRATRSLLFVDASLEVEGETVALATAVLKILREADTPS
jgi:uncharacterized protein (TIGR00369 family)